MHARLAGSGAFGAAAASPAHTQQAQAHFALPMLTRRALSTSRRTVLSDAGGLERAGGRAAVAAAVAAGQGGRPRLAGARGGPGLHGWRLERGGLAAGRQLRRLQAREARLARLQDAVRDPARVSGRASSHSPPHCMPQ